MSNLTASKKTTGVNAKDAKRMREETRWLHYRINILPCQLETAYRRLNVLKEREATPNLSYSLRYKLPAQFDWITRRITQLETEARSLGMEYLIRSESDATD